MAKIEASSMALSSQAHYFASALEHTLEVIRENGEKLHLTVNHSKDLIPPTTMNVAYVSSDPNVPVEFGTETFCGKDELNLVLMSNDREPMIRQEVSLSFQEARFLRDLLNRPEVLAHIDPEPICECCHEKGAIQRSGTTSRFCESCFEDLSR